MTVTCAAQAAAALRGDGPPAATKVEAALRTAIDDAFATAHPPKPALLPGRMDAAEQLVAVRRPDGAPVHRPQN
ncbi:hypothetical protein ACFY04_33010 [Streptomyces sp. NPDC001549]|uniref:hypothetical protein n=1 Tax=Streptomyces sp. NPDC001549 TaxID=3364586 RepID=UPI003697E186